MKEDKMGRICSTHREDKKRTQNCGLEMSEGRAFEREANINIDLGKIGCEGGIGLNWLRI
jgi:hypothetical protein